LKEPRRRHGKFNHSGAQEARSLVVILLVSLLAGQQLLPAHSGRPPNKHDQNFLVTDGGSINTVKLKGSMFCLVFTFIAE